MGMVPMRNGDSRKRRHSDSARNARDNFERHAGLGECPRFFAASPEDEWVSALQAAHIFAFTRLLDHEPMDMFLLEGLLACFFPDAEDLGFRPGLLEQV